MTTCRGMRTAPREGFSSVGSVRPSAINCFGTLGRTGPMDNANNPGTAVSDRHREGARLVGREGRAVRGISGAPTAAKADQTARFRQACPSRHRQGVVIGRLFL